MICDLRRDELVDGAQAEQLAAQVGLVAGDRVALRRERLREADLRRQLLRLRAVNQLVAPKVQITDEDIRARYDQMQRRSEAVSAVQLSHILVKLPEHPTEQQLTEAKDKAAKAMDRVKAGEAFAAVAKDVSEDPSTSANGGELGWFQRGSINPDWEQIVFSMNKAMASPGHRPAGAARALRDRCQAVGAKPYDQMKDQLQRELRRREPDKQTQTWTEELRKKA